MSSDERRGEDRDRRQRGDLDGDRDERDEQDREAQAPRVERVDVAVAKRDVREQVDRRAAEQRGGRDELQRVLDVAERLLHAERDEHDPRDHREVQVGVGVARHLVLLAPDRRLGEPARGDEEDDVEVQPPLRGRDRHPERPRRATIPASTFASAPTPIATIDSPSAMMMISPWRSAKWCGASFQPSAPKKYGPAHVEQQRDAPTARPAARRRRTRRRRAGRRRSPCSIARPTTDLRNCGSSRLASRNSADVRDAHDRVGEREDQRVVVERVRARRARRRAAPPSRRRSRAGRRPPRGRRRSSATRSRPTTTTARRARAGPSRGPPTSARRP